MSVLTRGKTQVTTNINKSLRRYIFFQGKKHIIPSSQIFSYTINSFIFYIPLDRADKGKEQTMKKLIVTAILGAIAVSSMACPECDGCFGNHYGFCSEAEAVEQAEPIEKPKKEPKKEKKYFWMPLGEFEITAYCGGTCCSSGTGITASGNVAEEGKTIGVDPDIIPLGSKVKIVFADGTEHVYRADDTGSAINGNIIDLYMGTAESGGHERALQFGRQTCKVYIRELNDERN